MLSDKCKMSRDTARLLSLLADTYSLTCDIVVNDSAAVTANTDTVGMLTLFICVSCSTDKCKMSRDTARQLSLLADT